MKNQSLVKSASNCSFYTKILIKMNYIAPMEQLRLQEALDRQMKIDKTYVAPKVLFKTNRF